MCKGITMANTSKLHIPPTITSHLDVLCTMKYNSAACYNLCKRMS